jgi:hypothetical protein
LLLQPEVIRMRPTRNWWIVSYLLDPGLRGNLPTL